MQQEVFWKVISLHVMHLTEEQLFGGQGKTGADQA
jgi:hypothetical protein